MKIMCTPQLGSNDDNALIEAFRLGDQRAGNALFRKYEPYLKRVCWKFRRQHDWLDAGDLDDAVSEAFALALKNYDRPAARSGLICRNTWPVRPARFIPPTPRPRPPSYPDTSTPKRSL